MPSAPKKHPAAVALGKRARGKPKTLTPAALEQRRKAGFQPKPKRLPKATIAAAQADARDDRLFSAPPAWEDDEE